MAIQNKSFGNFARGDTLDWTLTIKTDAGAVIDVTGWEFWITFKSAVTDTDASALLQLLFICQADALTSEVGLVDIFIDPKYSDLLTNNNRAIYYDIQAVIPDVGGDIVSTIFKGVVTPVRDVTRNY